MSSQTSWYRSAEPTGNMSSPSRPLRHTSQSQSHRTTGHRGHHARPDTHRQGTTIPSWAAPALAPAPTTPAPTPYKVAVAPTAPEMPPSPPPKPPTLPTSSQPRGHHATVYSNRAAGGHHSSRRSYRPHAPAPRSQEEEQRRADLARVAHETIQALNEGRIMVPDRTTGGGTRHSLRAKLLFMKDQTTYYPEESAELHSWRHHGPKARRTAGEVMVQIIGMTTVQGALYCDEVWGIGSGVGEKNAPKTGVLNFASATKPGGGFLNGAQAQEESIARSSSLYASLILHKVMPFYALHADDDRDGYYSHGMIYSPYVQIIRNAKSEWIPPVRVEVVTSPAVNAKQVREKRRFMKSKSSVEDRIVEVMEERMGRILALFELHGVQNLVLGSFGTGVFQNNVRSIANIWAKLLEHPGARFKHSFDNVVFTIPDAETQSKFKEGFYGPNYQTRSASSL